ncbi:GlsB/YeaQ/YmgE family stress response membrane protein [Burkholderia sp. Bp8998]|uniref:GlsB/YeaQ/YmgE family stress response membrane protein n=1 Tax=Burkholderia sp. Bp8998 TaxID=2184557 RepID=UPI000F5A7DB4|nr:GlsB/YeaQ/YmgE family stress response membrane protein [Burkholderia sp. Bp8998]RQS19448.1 GlsB/YeaQ/YmgE family stress response membrane protein [Burkholderia sp. Bp8998]
MGAHGFIVWIVIGAIAGWLAGLIVQGVGFGVLIDIVVGIVGAFVGGWLSSTMGIATGGGYIVSTIVAIVGAVIFLLAIRLVRGLLS